MHDPPFGQGQDQRLWLFSGTGEGPALARAWLESGWRLTVFVVTASAARAYGAFPGLRLQVGAVGDRSALDRALQEARLRGESPLWIIDATHPFATRISSDLAAVCQARSQPLLRLVRPEAPQAAADPTGLVSDWGAVAAVVPAEGRVLLAIGARQLSTAIRVLPGRVLHARVLPSADSLALALASGLTSDRLAALKPGPMDPLILEALCRQWRIGTVVARASGGSTERCWRQLRQSLGLQLVLLQRPPLRLAGVELPWAEALRRLSPGADAPGR